MSSPKEAEALGLREAARWLLELRVSNVIVELDAKGVYDVFYSKTLDRSEFGMLIQDCRSLFLDQSFTLYHVKRQAMLLLMLLQKQQALLLVQVFGGMLHLY